MTITSGSAAEGSERPPADGKIRRWRRSGLLWVCIGLGVGFGTRFVGTHPTRFDDLPVALLGGLVAFGISIGGFQRLLWGAPTGPHAVPRFLRFVISFAAALALFHLLESILTTPPPDSLLKYPYHASPDREATIRSGLPKLAVGMMSGDVQAILGTPDWIAPLYKPPLRIGRQPQVGYTYWYLVQRLTYGGSMNDRAEKLVRVSTDLERRVTDIDHWGLEPDSNGQTSSHDAAQPGVADGPGPRLRSEPGR